MASPEPAVGDVIPPLVVPAVSAEKMKTMAALIDDPNPIHFDLAAVRRLGLGEAVVNQGPSNMGYIVNALIAWTGDARCVRNVRCRFTGNVFADDRVVASGVVTAVGATSDGVTTVDCDVWLSRGEDTADRVVTGTARVVLPG